MINDYLPIIIGLVFNLKKLKFIFSYEFLKRNLDIFFALFTIILLSPLLILIYLLIFFFDNGPVIFKQLRVGKNGKYFTIYKFRTMNYIKDYKFDGLINELSKETIEKAREKFKTTKRNDPRISKIGKLIRPIHFDELPQLINVIKGDMSFVGPRPDVPVQKVDYPENFWRMRISLKPGITGLAQIYQCKDLMERNILDRLYLRKRSFLFDLYILIRTFLKLIYLKSN